MKADSERYVITPYGVRSPKVIYGTAWKKSHTGSLVAAAVELGFRGIDTAGQPKHYDEAGVGAALNEVLDGGPRRSATAGLRRADLYLQTKFTPPGGQDPSRIPYDPRARPAEQVAQSFTASLRNLQTSYVDCLVLHSPLRDAAQMTEVWQAMETLFDAGGAKQLGISNCYEPAFLAGWYERVRVKPAVVQNRFYAETNYDREIRAFCRQRQIVYQSFWTLSANPRLLADAVLKALASKYERTPAQILFRYLTQEGAVPLTGTTSASHMRQALEIFEFTLEPAERERITRLLEPGDA